jgi:hypothetical protein
MHKKKLKDFIINNSLNCDWDKDDIILEIPFNLMKRFAALLSWEYFIDNCYLRCEMKRESVFINMQDILWYYDISKEELSDLC